MGVNKAMTFMSETDHVRVWTNASKIWRVRATRSTTPSKASDATRRDDRHTYP